MDKMIKHFATSEDLSLVLLLDIFIVNLTRLFTEGQFWSNFPSALQMSFRGFWFFSFSTEYHLSTLNIMHMYIWWNSVSLYLNFKFLVCLCLVYTDHVYPKTELLLYSDINVLSFVDIQLQWKGLEMSYLYCSPLAQTLCAACGEQCDRLSLTQLLPWAKSVNGRASEVDVSLCLMVHPPSLRLRSLLSSNFQGQGTDVEAEEEAQLCSTLHLH